MLVGNTNSCSKKFVYFWPVCRPTIFALATIASIAPSFVSSTIEDWVLEVAIGF